MERSDSKRGLSPSHDFNSFQSWRKQQIFLMAPEAPLARRASSASRRSTISRDIRSSRLPALFETEQTHPKLGQSGYLADPRQRVNRLKGKRLECGRERHLKCENQGGRLP